MVNDEVLTEKIERKAFLESVQKQIEVLVDMDPANYFMNDIVVDQVFDTVAVLERNINDEIAKEESEIDALNRWTQLTNIHRSWVESNKAVAI